MTYAVPLNIAFILAKYPIYINVRINTPQREKGLLPLYSINSKILLQKNMLDELLPCCYLMYVTCACTSGWCSVICNFVHCPEKNR